MTTQGSAATSVACRRGSIPDAASKKGGLLAQPGTHRMHSTSVFRSLLEGFSLKSGSRQILLFG
jgi:hypothetical protein